MSGPGEERPILHALDPLWKENKSESHGDMRDIGWGLKLADEAAQMQLWPSAEAHRREAMLDNSCMGLLETSLQPPFPAPFLPPNSAITGYAIDGVLFISTQLCSPTLQHPPKGLGTDN